MNFSFKILDKDWSSFVSAPGLATDFLRNPIQVLLHISLLSYKSNSPSVGLSESLDTI